MSTPKLGKETSQRIAELETDLLALLEEIETYIGSKSQKWADSDAGTAWRAWADEAQTLLDAIDAFPTAPDL